MFIFNYRDPKQKIEDESIIINPHKNLYDLLTNIVIVHVRYVTTGKTSVE